MQNYFKPIKNKNYNNFLDQKFDDELSKKTIN